MVLCYERIRHSIWLLHLFLFILYYVNLFAILRSVILPLFIFTILILLLYL